MTLSIVTSLSCKTPSHNRLKIIPEPVKADTYEGFFTLNSQTAVIFNSSAKRVSDAKESLRERLSKIFGVEVAFEKYNRRRVANSIFLKLDTTLKIKREGYLLNIDKRGVVIESNTPEGLFYGVQSLVQIADKSENNTIIFPYCSIEDYPRFSWRGLHLDVCRHFMPKEFVKSYIDYMSLHKFNIFHFHLTEDQGWRAEIKRYPLLTEVGSIRSKTLIGHGRSSDKYDDTPHGGFYTQEDLKEIVEYAAARSVIVVPEIEMPGHALAALASYPHLGCTGGPYEVAARWGVFHDVMCAGRESTFEFVEGVLDEILDIFPSEYIHIGGDECPKSKWEVCPHCQERMRAEGLKDEHELQSYFIKRVESFLNKRGRKLIGWDEILEGGLAPNAAVMSWRGEEGGIAAAKQSHFVVMTPGSHCYLDHYQGNKESEPLAIGGYTPLEKIYSYEPVPASLLPDESIFIMGAQGNVWTEYMKDPKHVEYMVYPRAAALAEVVWSPLKERDYQGFLSRLKRLLKIYDIYDINYSQSAFIKGE